MVIGDDDISHSSKTIRANLADLSQSRGKTDCRRITNARIQMEGEAFKLLSCKFQATNICLKSKKSIFTKIEIHLFFQTLYCICAAITMFMTVTVRTMMGEELELPVSQMTSVIDLKLAIFTKMNKMHPDTQVSQLRTLDSSPWTRC